MTEEEARRLLNVRTDLTADQQQLMHMALKAANLHAEQRDVEAMRLLDYCLKLDPALPDVLFLKGIIALTHGQYKEGFGLFELRLIKRANDIKVNRYGLRHQERPQWDGRPTLERVLIWGDEGMGDVAQMLRFMPEVKRRCPRLQFEVHQPWVDMCRMNDIGGDVFRVASREPKFDLQCPLMSLPRVLGVTLDNLSGAPYLTAPSLLVKSWGAHWKDRPDLKFGISWTGNPTNVRNDVRSISQELLKPLADEFDFISLQREHSCVDDIADMAALIENLDLVISIDTLAAHLAGALGKEVWVLLGVDCDWRWMQERLDSPWYNSARLFRQTTPGDWAPVLAEVAQELRKRNGNARTATAS